MVARWQRSLGSGKRFTLACQPSDAKATTQWCNATPQLRINSRPSGSVLRSCISGLENSSRLVGHTRHRHGCVLWMEGARTARVRTVRTVSASGKWVFMAAGPFPSTAAVIY
ncbi:Uncharacterised protein [Mycobacterium tuberculosis]|uniref:Uncharacterized protein n=1 Tax=Mycobacterium tuberculosis TaxID=1773 RepID=A0A0T9FDH6_MYCTX|nr:Uncharacterised protein [Mycobacterium tuberculosis]CKT29489.1 Uncharacterised protein [Mycobacterium tuberculosis]CKU11730.1 Uncharacterised protein [Mycobacterium tuberculosis]CKV48436.1 Uncharacterised protein [Mycobacterium tuberculosis]CNU25977.1 Uncharacterised protein [Mycobacterium tuberculosis]